ncbi:MAG TPA: hypothetical protein VHL59_03625 [Thermoanaerobaculia bacterium]|nr:hypothetical protein [Thermoanaerobaculia bacterium]
MTRTALVLLLALLALPREASAQTARNAAYFELGGSAIIPSLNYERQFAANPARLWYGRLGMSFVTSKTLEDTETTFVIPLTVSSVNRPASNHHLELGGGVTFAAGDRQDLFESVDDDEQFSDVFLTGILGYRYQKPDGGFQFRAALTPLAGGGDFLPWFGLSFGYAW